MRIARIDPDTVSPPIGTLVGVNDMEAQTRKVFENLNAILSANMATFGHVVKVDAYIKDLAGLPAIREVRREFLGADPPASTLVEISGLVHPDALIEVDVVAVIPAT